MSSAVPLLGQYAVAGADKVPGCRINWFSLEHDADAASRAGLLLRRSAGEARRRQLASHDQKTPAARLRSLQNAPNFQDEKLDE
jgi:hypothetical protein